MERFPPLCGNMMEVNGVDWKQSAADISSVGWIAVTAGTGSIVSLKAYTPNGIGVFLRDPPLLPTSVRQRGLTKICISLFIFCHLYLVVQNYLSLVRASRCTIFGARKSVYVPSDQKKKSLIGKVSCRRKHWYNPVDEGC